MKRKFAFTHLNTLDTLGCELVLVAGGAVDVVLLRDEALGPDGVCAHAAHEALLVPLPGLVLHLLHAGPEHLPARVTPGSELLVVAVTAINSVRNNCQDVLHLNINCVLLTCLPYSRTAYPRD